MPRQRLLRWFREGLAAVEPRERVRQALSLSPVPARWHLLAVGKAAAAMAAGALEAWGEPHDAVVVVPAATAAGDFATVAGVRCLHGTHPIPDAASLAAGEALLEIAARLQSPARRHEPVLLLVSGGASALAEALVPGCTLTELQAMTRAALAEDADIVALNARRRALSRLKGGLLVRALGAHRVTALYLSDVPDDDPTVIGSGLACGATADTVPARLVCVGRLEDALAAIEAAALREGWPLERLPGRFAGPAVAVASEFTRQLRPGMALLWGGESTVALPPNPGRGGRNQHLALAAAAHLAHLAQWPRGPASGGTGPVLLAAGTDGIDGASDDAGAIVEATTLARGQDGSGRTSTEALAAADSGTFLEAAGDLLHTGPTGTNVGDILVACWPLRAAEGQP